MAFNWKSPTEVTLLHLLAKSEGRLQRDDFATKQLFYRLRNEKNIKQEKHGYKITDKFKTEYTKAYPTARFSSTGSAVHERGVLSVLKTLPPQALERVASAADLAAEHKELAKGSEYRAAVASIRQDLAQQRQALQTQAKAAQTRLEAAQAREQIREIDRYSRKLNDPHRGISPADLRVTLTRDQAAEVIERMREPYPEQARELERVVEQSQEPDITILAEITTPNYEKDQYFSHTAYAIATNTTIIYFFAT